MVRNVHVGINQRRYDMYYGLCGLIFAGLIALCVLVLMWGDDYDENMPDIEDVNND